MMPRCSRIFSILVMLIVSVAANCGAAEGSREDKSETAGAVDSTHGIPVIDASMDPMRIFLPELPGDEGTCYLYPDYIVIAWRSPEQKGPVAIVRKRDKAGGADGPDCSPDSLPGDYVFYNDWAEYFSGMWGDLLLIDSGTSNIRSLYFYDVRSRSRVLSLEGFGGTDGWIDEVTIRVWLLSAADMPRSLCPDIPEIFSVGVDSLFALDLKELSLEPLGSWRCNQLQ